MKMHVVGTLMLISMLLFAGCTHWYQAGKSFDDCKQDRMECLDELKNYSSNWNNMGDYELKFMENCICQKGYTLLGEGELPLHVKREGPYRLSSYYPYGISGTINQK